MLDVSPTFDIRFGGLFHSPLFGNDNDSDDTSDIARLAQLVERKALNLVVVGSSPTVGVIVNREMCNLHVVTMQMLLLMGSQKLS